MESVVVQLHKAVQAEDGYALCVEGDAHGPWRAQRGYGSAFEKIWTVELQSPHRPDLAQVDWDAVMERVIEAYDLNDPVISDYHWPMRESV